MDIPFLTKEHIDLIPYDTKIYLYINNASKDEYIIKNKILDNNGCHVADSIAHWKNIETEIYPISSSNIGNT